MLLYSLLAVFLILDFLILNTKPLYSYLLTLVLIVPILSIYPKYIKQVILVMLGFVIVGSTLYLSFPPPTWTIFYLRMQKIGNNLNALGYYLLVDCLIAFIIYTIIQNYSLESKVKKIKKFIWRNSAGLSYLLFIIALILIIGPFWPVSLAYYHQTYVNQTIPIYNSILTRSYNLSAGIVVPINYALVPVCSAGSNTSFKVAFSANQPAIEFYMRNYSGISNLGVAPFQEYLNYIKMNAGGVTALGTRGALNFSTLGSCAEFGVLTQMNNNFMFHVTEEFRGISYKVVRVPVLGAYLIVNKTSDIISSMAYLKAYILPASSPQTSTAST